MAKGMAGMVAPGRRSTCRDEVLQAAKDLAARSSDGTFTPEEVVRLLLARGTAYAESTVRTHVISRMCVNAPGHHARRYADLVRDERGRYRLAQPGEPGTE
ncbi:DUF7669 domain-containing protein [Micromonospora chalcea]|uniref:DUF7669 domain-containing protein n=1 Tax=Micromonospora chalcea TaxID=1874 RepID=UPI003F4CC744